MSLRDLESLHVQTGNKSATPLAFTRPVCVCVCVTTIRFFAIQYTFLVSPPVNATRPSQLHATLVTDMQLRNWKFQLGIAVSTVVKGSVNRSVQTVQYCPAVVNGVARLVATDQTDRPVAYAYARVTS